MLKRIADVVLWFLMWVPKAKEPPRVAPLQVIRFNNGAPVQPERYRWN